MSSNETAGLADLERDIPTTAVDVAALRAARRIRPADPFAEIQQLVDSLPPQARRQRRTTSAGWPRFEL